MTREHIVALFARRQMAVDRRYAYAPAGPA